MANTSTITFIIFSTLAAVLVSSAARPNILVTPTVTVDNTALTENWLKNLNAVEKQKLTVVHFYLHDVVVAEHRTVYNLTGPVIPDSPTWFGLIQVVDHLLTAGRENTSESVGRAQGIHIFSDFNIRAITMLWNFVFSDGSTISMLGRQDVNPTTIVLPIVGGTGKYMMARGIAVRTVLERDPVTLNAIQEYTIYILATNPAVSG